MILPYRKWKHVLSQHLIHYMKTKTVLRNNEVQLLAKFKNEDDFVKLDSWKKKQNQ